MAINYEFERHIQVAKEAGDEMAVKALGNQRDSFNILVQAKIVTELPREAAAKEQTKVEAPAVVINSPEKQDRQLREALSPFIREYKSTALWTPDLISHTWDGIWKVIGDRVDFEYQVPETDRTTEELAQLRKDNKANLLLADDIFTPEGLARLGRAFPLMISSSIDPEVASRITHDSNIGGSVDIEMSLDAPYRTRKGLTESELAGKIAADGRLGQRLPTYLIGSQFSQLLTGHYFDENTWSRLLGSRNEGFVLSGYFFTSGDAGVLGWVPERQYPALGGRSEGVKA